MYELNPSPNGESVRSMDGRTSIQHDLVSVADTVNNLKNEDNSKSRSLRKYKFSSSINPSHALTYTYKYTQTNKDRKIERALVNL